MSWFKEKRIFLDYASATPTLPEVKRVMEKYLVEYFYNPSAIYEEGLTVKRVVEKHRLRIAKLLGIQSEGLVFTSSGTEANNLAILGTFAKSLEKVRHPHVIVSAIEHPSIIACAEEVVRRGGEMSILKVDESGLVSPAELAKLIKKNTVLVSVALANHEVGTIQPVAKLGRVIRKYRKTHGISYPYLHTDVAAGANFLPLYMESLQADLMTLDGGKIYGPKGVGLLATRGIVEIGPIIFGGDQEGGRRAGTINPGLIAGITLALERAESDREKESKRLQGYRKSFVDYIAKKLSQASVNGSETSHLPNIISIGVPGTLAEFVVIKLDRAGVAVSTGAGCSLDGRVSGSPVIRALGKEPARLNGVSRSGGDLAEATVRISMGRYTTWREVEKAAEIFCKVVKSVIK